MAVEGIGGGKIVPIELLRQRRADAAREKEQQATGRTEADRPATRPSAADRRAARRSEADRSEADRSAEDRNGLMAEIRSDLEDLPEVRRDKVIEARLRISSGYYDREEVRKQILQSVLGSILSRTGTESPEADGPAEADAESAAPEGPDPASPTS